MQAYSTPDVQQTFGWGLDPECKERMLKLMDEAREGVEILMDEEHEDRKHSSFPRGKSDPVNSPGYYAKGWSNGSEVIDIAENLNFNRGSAVKYITRAGKKYESKEAEDLRKAIWYLERELVRIAQRV